VNFIFELQKLELVNGVIFTGGWAKTGLYYDVVEKIFNKVMEKNDAGEHFPVYAMCLGFEILSMIISQVTLLASCFFCCLSNFHICKAMFHTA